MLLLKCCLVGNHNSQVLLSNCRTTETEVARQLTQSTTTTKGDSASNSKSIELSDDIITKGNGQTKPSGSSTKELNALEPVLTEAKVTMNKNSGKSRGKDKHKGESKGKGDGKFKGKGKGKGKGKHNGTHKIEELDDKSSETLEGDLELGTAVQLLDEATKVVGTGRIASQSSSHGRDIPDGYLNVEITTIASNVKPHVASPLDEDFVCVGQFILWPRKQLQAGIRSPINTRSK